MYNLRKKIEQKVQLSLQKSWIPKSFLYQGVRECENSFFKSSYNSMYPLKTINVRIPSSQNNTSPGINELSHTSIIYFKTF